MLGAIIGDIAGSRFEFNNMFDYGFEMFSDKCSYTDDTICTVAVADAILNGKSYQNSMLKWCRKYPFPMGGYGSMFAGWICSPRPLIPPLRHADNHREIRLLQSMLGI